MKISLNWFKEFFKFNLDLKETEEICLLKGIEIENINPKKTVLEKCFSGKVLDINKISENLYLCKIDIKGEIFKSITSATNINQGDVVPVVLNGGKIYKTVFKTNGKESNPTTIKPVEFNGILSEAMLLSYDEIGIPEENLSEKQKNGIFILPSDTDIGENLIDLLWLNDTILDIKTNNRGDVLSLIGLAEEFERYGLGIVKKRDYFLNKKDKFNKSDFKIEIKNIELCPRYVGIIIKDVNVKTSSINNLRKLLSVGLRPVNNIVDWTNVFMYEYGQPLHAFDFDKIDTKIVVREAEANEKIVTLDGKERELEEGMLLICDIKSPIAIAGVIGGKDTEVNDDTKNVFLESANFSPQSISKTKRKLKIETEAGNRFEKGVDIEKTELIGSICAFNFEGKEMYGPIDIYSKPYIKEKIELRYDRVRKILGVGLSNKDIINSLEKGGFKVIEQHESSSIFECQYFRPDVKSEIDLIEEVVRYYGIEKIEYSIPSAKIDSYEEDNTKKLKKRIRGILTSLSFNEVITLSLIDNNFLYNFNDYKNLIEILNPLRNDQNVLRSSLLPSLLKIAERNIKNRNKNLAIFEIGKIYYIDNNECKETDEVSALVTGKRVEKYWGESDKEYDYFYIKGALEALLNELGIKNFNIININPKTYFHPYRYGKIIISNEEIGEIGEINSKILSLLSIEQKIYVFNLNFEKLLNYTNIKTYYKEIPKYPSLTFDISMIINKNIKTSDVLKILKEEGDEILYKILLFDVYEDEKIGKNKKSLAFSLIFNSNIKTLKDSDVFPIIERIEKRIEKELKGTLRKKY
ncbi:MAG TPA: phenylalanine--tRNA ligase subunit beta [Caldisericia bacterium]|nr:phenylalanine--tRNA ligase subunit beta [Caldisericia bacterium]HRT37370.1 phenylalanine--tRNA ligase subunit beta [Caldisericia bacterium]